MYKYISFACGLLLRIHPMWVCAQSDELKTTSDDQGILVAEGDRPILFYQRATKSMDGKWPRAGYIHPLYGLDGQTLTEDFPIDHRHHRGIFWAWHQVWVGDKLIGDPWLCQDFQWEVVATKIARREQSLVLLSDVDGFYSANPAADRNARRFDVIDDITPEIEAMAGDAGSGLSKGGMKTKVLAARMATAGGCAMAITEGSADNPLQRLEQGAPATWFTAHGDPQGARKRWIAAMKPRGEIEVDDGAANALSQGKSLLPAGVRTVSGSFGRGDPVAIVAAGGRKIGQGLSRYTAQEASAIRGRKSHEIEQVLGYPGRAALIHRDDMAL